MSGRIKKLLPLLLSLSFGIISWMGWPERGFAPLLFFAWVPLLMLEDLCFHQKRKWFTLFAYAYSGFFLWNLLTTWWIYNSSVFGAAIAVVCNSLFMSLVFLLFHFTRKKTGDAMAYPALIGYWISFEYLHLNWDLSWPWLTLGNGFASYYKWIQWYEFTGVLGGSLWTLSVNIMLFRLLFYSGVEVRRPKAFLIALVLIVPFAVSYFQYSLYHEKEYPVKIVVVQPNIDPYNEKFSGMSGREQLTKLLQLAASKTDSSTDFLVAPETALPSGIWEEELKSHPEINLLRSYMKAFPNLTVIIGASTYKQYLPGEKISETARKFTRSEGYYDSYNTALQLDNFSDSIGLYHKSKLVPGVEKMPYPEIFGFLEKFSIDLGGMSGSLGTEKEPKVFSSMKSVKAAPVICYESVYGDYLADYVKKGAELIFIITNDGWWGNTPGHRQHLVYGRLRAIEMRRSIARSANTGISCFINQRGDIQQLTAYWEEDVIEQTINTNRKVTFYARYGDFVAKAALIFSIAALLLSFIKRKNQ